RGREPVRPAARPLLPRDAATPPFLVGTAVAASRGLLHAQQVHLQLAIPQWVTPSLSWTAVAGIALPLFVVTMASQN
ncbi:benzoate/H(+) symporter BenE family transporter, partial [Mycobacterium tuberculosis]|nr:benzoate/H(+) symporter BenE family transporter [Mycobacterium tuberculosis]